MWRALVVDDKPVMKNRIQRIVELWHERFDVTGISAGAETEGAALGYIRECSRSEKPIHVAIVDLMLTEAQHNEGIRVCAALRKAFPDCFIILASGYTETYELDREVINEFVSYVLRPEEYRDQLDRHLATFLKTAAPYC
jgi:CheY-like chemotaxis protein